MSNISVFMVENAKPDRQHGVKPFNSGCIFLLCNRSRVTVASATVLQTIMFALSRIVEMFIYV